MLGRPAASQRDAGGLTLLELLLVVALIAALAAVTLGAGRRAVESARAARARSELATIATALEAYRRVFGDYPHTADGAVLLQSLLGRRDPAGSAMQARAVIELPGLSTASDRDPRSEPAAVLVDPWGRPYRYVYRVPAAGWMNSRFVLYSAGPDGRDRAALLAGGFPDLTAVENDDNIGTDP